MALSSYSMSTSDLAADHMASDASLDSENPPLISVKNVSKIFCRDLKKSMLYGVRDSLHDLTLWGRARDPHPQNARSLRNKEFYAVKDISFELRRGECLGLIGHNGAGKTTLLKMLNGLIKPDSGRIEMRGRVGALIALGAGFNPLLTGRENIYVNGLVLGLSRSEIDQRLEELINFAELREFIDAPVQSYSSGMQVRLGFSVAIAVQPDILLLDEVLAVGDIGFVIKCLNKMREMIPNTAVVFVSHSMQFVSSFCTRIMVMEKGLSVLQTSDIQRAVNKYLKLAGSSASELKNADITISDFTVLQPAVTETDVSEFQQGASITVAFALNLEKAWDDLFLRVDIDDEAANQVISYRIHIDSKEELSFSAGTHRVEVELGVMDLNSGHYSFMLAVSDAKARNVIYRRSGVHPFDVCGAPLGWSKIVRNVEGQVASTGSPSPFPDQ